MREILKPTSVRFEKSLLCRLDRTAHDLHRSKGWVIQEAVRHYLDVCADLDLALEKLKNPSTEYEEWEGVRDELLHKD